MLFFLLFCLSVCRLFVVYLYDDCSPKELNLDFVLLYFFFNILKMNNLNDIKKLGRFAILCNQRGVCK